LRKVGESEIRIEYWPTIENGSRRAISAKQTSAELGFSSWCLMTRIGLAQSTSTAPSSRARSASPTPGDGRSSTASPSAASAPITWRHRTARKAQSGGSRKAAGALLLSEQKKTLARPGEGLFCRSRY
jgi:hypothetical protein